MSKAETISVDAADDGIRLDRWFKRHYPQLPFGQVAKLIRTGQVRLDGARAKANARIEEGQEIRLPPAVNAQQPSRNSEKAVSDEDAAFIQSLVIHKDDDVIALNKPSGLAVQGGSKTHRHIDGMLDALRFGKTDRPKLVHRLDRDTSGVLLIARSASSAAKLTAAFRRKDARKVYWGLTAQVPRPQKGMIDLPLMKERAQAGEDFRERVIPADRHHPDSKKAISYYAVVQQAAETAAWLALMPLTGRTHQLRVHCAAIGTPLVGDLKYGGDKAALSITGGMDAETPRLHLHARSINIAHPSGGRLHVQADLPSHMAESWAFLEWDTSDDGDPFAELEL